MNYLLLFFLCALPYSSSHPKHHHSWSSSHSNLMDHLTDFIDQVEATAESMENIHMVNITLIGSQVIYNRDGSVKEIRSIELSVPNFQSEDRYDEDEFDIDDLETRRQLWDIIQTKTNSLRDMGFTNLKYNEYGHIERESYIAKDLIVDIADGVVFVNRTIRLDNLEQVDADYNRLKTSSQSISRLVYDKEGKFVSIESTVVPELFAFITSNNEEPASEIVLTTHKLFVDTFLETGNKDDIPEKLRQHLESQYPKIEFMVTVGEPEGFYIYKDFTINLKYDFLFFEEEIHYSVYGHNRTADLIYE